MDFTNELLVIDEDLDRKRDDWSIDERFDELIRDNH